MSNVQIPSLSLPDLETVKRVRVEHTRSVTDVALPALHHVESLRLEDNAALVDVVALQQAEGFSVVNNPVLTALHLPALQEGGIHARGE